MQKTSFFSTAKTLIFRGIITGIVALVVFIGSLGALQAFADDDGGEFGKILNMILQTGNWKNPGDGTVKNSEKLGNIPADKFQVISGSRECPPNQCVVGFQENGKIICK